MKWSKISYLTCGQILLIVFNKICSNKKALNYRSNTCGIYLKQSPRFYLIGLSPYIRYCISQYSFDSIVNKSFNLSPHHNYDVIGNLTPSCFLPNYYVEKCNLFIFVFFMFSFPDFHVFWAWHHYLT